MSNINSFIEKYNIKCESVMVDNNPHMDSQHQMNHYKVTLKRDKTINGYRERGQMTLYFSMGLGFSREPNADDVLECLAMDFSSIDCAHNFEDWAADMGYDPDSRKAEKTYRTTQKNADKLLNFLGNGTYKELLSVEF